MSQLFMRRPHLADLSPLADPHDGMILRVGVPEDAEALADLLNAAFPEGNWTPEKARRELLEAQDVATVFLMVDAQGRPIATASARRLPDKYPGSGYVHWVGVHPDAQGQRLGYRISHAVLEEFVRLGCRDAVLETDDFRLPAIKTYLRLGFVPEFRDETHTAR